jgi:hypothetical protein
MTTKTTKAKEQSRAAAYRGVAGDIGSAVTAGGKAYVNGILELSRTLGGFGREILTDAGDHVRKTVQAKCIREVAELQAAYAQHRIEMSATHTKEFADLAGAKSKEVIKPLADLINQDKAA